MQLCACAYGTRLRSQTPWTISVIFPTITSLARIRPGRRGLIAIRGLASSLTLTLGKKCLSHNAVTYLCPYRFLIFKPTNINATLIN
ncbi:uncharacterized protein H6S33_008719 [Morchella sextelata]|uniref:uncharacterized protein n=1 Tax=Morchella sextelata TaxID=1174677 RepID=UPI001D047A58|nr:uncharacterized protein H6S33_008719 [Morchella sextelata]KAH0602380.1 hypothetical protein H6S33_008719 [Morchella sextelata]